MRRRYKRLREVSWLCSASCCMHRHLPEIMDLMHGNKAEDARVNFNGEVCGTYYSPQSRCQRVLYSCNQVSPSPVAQSHLRQAASVLRHIPPSAHRPLNTDGLTLQVLVNAPTAPGSYYLLNLWGMVSPDLMSTRITASRMTYCV